ncbi:N-acetylmuramoyl-L-alanine amidase [Serinicoccus hydrothermalis]|uniref:N-acetylmuramoyl-L-alanine amidase n=1 Tax=Serinicoccus hydrothermalis TaxID=1758689 RepID=A0A1B1NCU6_9MICO|nr:cell wall-binding repeat-containing protein [Serinicoccus hydrothermalis]ANS79246.1 N-acetylmuramoyl-L-alanine amidase [Serinicoccus hydrothermalis]
MPSLRRLLLSTLTAAAIVVPAGPLAVAAQDETVDGAEHRSVALEPVATATSAESADVLRGTVALDPREVSVVGLRWSGDADSGARMRLHDGQAWGEWTPLEKGVATGPDMQGSGEWGTEAAVVLEADRVQVELSQEAQQATVETWTSKVTAADVAQVESMPTTDASNEGVIIGRRADWAGDMELIPSSGPVLSRPKLGVTIHHTATSAYYEPQDVPAMLRSIYNYHARTLDWRDIGYNALVDRYGRAWEGRSGGLENNVQGAHSYGMNADWFGLSSLGNHEISPVPQAELGALAVTTAWALDQHGADVNGTVTYTNEYLDWTRRLPVLHGHRDVYATSCPGWRLYQLFGTLRSQVAAQQQQDRSAVQRIGGADRYAVAAGLAKEAAVHGARTAYLTQGAEIADALGVGPVASRTGSAVLLTRTQGVPGPTLDALEDLGTEEVVVVGGETAVSPGVERSLRQQGYAVRRVAGANRYDTAVQLSREQRWTGGTVYLASGSNLADALGGGAAAAHTDAPMLLTHPGHLTTVTAARLAEMQPARVVVLGGTGAVENSVVRQAEELLPWASVERIGGTNRYTTSALVAQDAFPEASSAVVASGSAPVDAVAGTQLAADREAPLLLTRKTCRTSAVDEAYSSLGIGLSRLAGGTGVLGWDAGARRC